MNIPVGTGDGVYLIGEAAKEYVQYKYFSTIFNGIILGIAFVAFGYFLMKIFKMLKDE